MLFWRITVFRLHYNIPLSSLSSSKLIKSLKLRSYVHKVIALEGAALIKLIGKPLYRPRSPSVWNITCIARPAEVYTGMLLYTYLLRVGPCTWMRLRTRSSGKTAVLAMTLAVMPAVASPPPQGRWKSLSWTRRPSYEAKKMPMKGMIWASAGPRPRKKPLKPSSRWMSHRAPLREEYTLCLP